MTIYFCGGEEIDFEGPAYGVSSLGYNRGDYSRGYVMGNTWPRSPQFAEGEVTSLWASSWIYHYSAYDFHAVGACTYNGGVLHLISAYRNTSGKIVLLKYNGSGWTTLATESGSSVSGTNQHKIDLHIQNYSGENQSIQVYVDTVLKIDYSGEAYIAGCSGFDRVTFWTNSNSNPFYGAISEVIAADIDTRLMALKTLAPNAAGDVSGEWTGAYTAIDEMPYNDTDLVYTTSSGENNIWQCNLTGWPSGDWICHGIKVSYRAADGVGGFGIQGGIETDSTNYSGELNTPSGAFQNYCDYWEENPYTLNRWTSGEINSLQFAIKAVGV